MAMYMVSGQTSNGGVCLESADGVYQAGIWPTLEGPDLLLVNLAVNKGMNLLWQVNNMGVSSAVPLFLIVRDTGAFEFWSGTPDKPEALIWSVPAPSGGGFGPFFVELDSTPSFAVYEGTPSSPGALVSQYKLP